MDRLERTIRGTGGSPRLVVPFVVPHARIYIYTYRPITTVRGPLPPLTPFFHLATRKKSERVKQGVLVAFHLIQGTARGEKGKEERADY